MLGNFTVRAVIHVLTERLCQSFMAEETNVSCYFCGNQTLHKPRDPKAFKYLTFFILTALFLLDELLMIIIQDRLAKIRHHT